MIGRDPRCYRFKLSPRSRDRDSRFDFAETGEIEMAANILLFAQLQRRPEIRDLRKTPSFWHDADDGGFLVIQPDCLTDYVTTAGEVRFPNFITNQHHRRRV